MAFKPGPRLAFLRARAAAALHRNRAQLALTGFVALACAVAYAMESRNDAIKRKIRTTRTIEDQVAAEERRLLDRMVREPAGAESNRQIRDLQRSVKYRYELEEE